MKKAKYILLGFVIFLPICILLASGFMLDFSLKSKVDKNDEQNAYEYIYKHNNLKCWVDSLKKNNALKDTFIYSIDKKKLHALYILSPKQPCNKTALLIHGYTDNSIRMLMIGYLYNHKMGYNVLIPDLQGQGKSRNNYIQMGWLDRIDILEWINIAKLKFGQNSRIVIHGISMGAATTMMTSGEKLSDNVKCFVEDCGYTSVWDEFSYKLKKEFHLPSFPLLYTTSLYCKLKLGWSFQEASAINQVKKCKLPMLFIHGEADTYVPTEMVYKLYAAKPNPKELWIAPKTEHAQSYWDHTAEYSEKTATFVMKYLN